MFPYATIGYTTNKVVEIPIEYKKYLNTKYVMIIKHPAQDINRFNFFKYKFSNDSIIRIPYYVFNSMNIDIDGDQMQIVPTNKIFKNKKNEYININNLIEPISLSKKSIEQKSKSKIVFNSIIDNDIEKLKKILWLSYKIKIVEEYIIKIIGGLYKTLLYKANSEDIKNIYEFFTKLYDISTKLKHADNIKYLYLLTNMFSYFSIDVSDIIEYIPIKKYNFKEELKKLKIYNSFLVVSKYLNKNEDYEIIQKKIKHENYDLITHKNTNPMRQIIGYKNYSSSLNRKNNIKIDNTFNKKNFNSKILKSINGIELNVCLTENEHTLFDGVSISSNLDIDILFENFKTKQTKIKESFLKNNFLYYDKIDEFINNENNEKYIIFNGIKKLGIGDKISSIHGEKHVINNIFNNNNYEIIPKKLNSDIFKTKETNMKNIDMFMSLNTIFRRCSFGIFNEHICSKDILDDIPEIETGYILNKKTNKKTKAVFCRLHFFITDKLSVFDNTVSNNIDFFTYYMIKLYKQKLVE